MPVWRINEKGIFLSRIYCNNNNHQPQPTILSLNWTWIFIIYQSCHGCIIRLIWLIDSFDLFASLLDWFVQSDSVYALLIGCHTSWQLFGTTSTVGSRIMQNGSVTFFSKEHMFWNFQNRNSIFRLWSCLWTWSVTNWTDTIQASRGEKKELKFSLIIVLSGSLYQNIYSSNQRCFLSSVRSNKESKP